MPENIKASEFRLLDDIFEMGGGYVLDFSNRTFSEFFKDELDIDIDHPSFEIEGTSKAKRLRYYLRRAPNTERVRVLLALWDYREGNFRRSGKTDPLPNHRVDFVHLIERLGGSVPHSKKKTESKNESSSFDASLAAQLHDELIALTALEPQPRGYAFEKFLRNLFDANDLSARASFKLTGEQIDGSFVLQGETYLLEAKWTNALVSSGDLRSFNAKVEDKAAWSRGLFVSNSGFSEEGLEAFGRGKSIICMDGLDISEMLQQKIPFSDVVNRKVRRVAETGRPFTRLRELY